MLGMHAGHITYTRPPIHSLSAWKVGATFERKEIREGHSRQSKEQAQKLRDLKLMACLGKASFYSARVEHVEWGQGR